MGKKNNLDQIFKELGFPEPPPYAPQPTPEFRERGPCGKVVFPSETAAKTCIRRKLKRNRTDTSKLRTYFCSTCKGWHLTKSFRNQA